MSSRAPEPPDSTPTPGASATSSCSSLCLGCNATPETDAQMREHKNASSRSRLLYMAEHARKMERERNWNENAWRRVVESHAILQEALKTVIVLASENPDTLVMHILASDSPIRRAWEMTQTNEKHLASGPDSSETN